MSDTENNEQPYILMVHIDGEPYLPLSEAQRLVNEINQLKEKFNKIESDYHMLKAFLDARRYEADKKSFNIK